MLVKQPRFPISPEYGIGFTTRCRKRASLVLRRGRGELRKACVDSTPFQPTKHGFVIAASGCDLFYGQVIVIPPRPRELKVCDPLVMLNMRGGE